MSLITVYTELPDGETVHLPAKILSTKGDVFTISYLSVTEKRDDHNRKIYKYEDETYEISDESISEYLNSDTELDFGFKQISDNEFIKYETDSDDDYVPSAEDDSSESSSGSEYSEENDAYEYDEEIYDE